MSVLIIDSDKIVSRKSVLCVKFLKYIHPAMVAVIDPFFDFRRHVPVDCKAIIYVSLSATSLASRIFYPHVHPYSSTVCVMIISSPSSVTPPSLRRCSVFRIPGEFL